MKYLLGGLVIVATFLAGCGKTAETGCTPVAPSTERAAMVAYCTANGINFTEHSSGILYEITAAGTGGSPNLSSTVTVVYTGKLLNGTTFDASANAISFPLTNVIQGWQIAIPLMKAGGRMRMVIPSSLAYSCVGTTGIPANSPLYFDVTLVSFR
jgi:FKBP-type peptidyl-prolyl cis-trans isomerase FkpA